MILCALEKLDGYKSLSTNLSIAIDFILNTDLNKLPIGKTEIDGENVYVNKVEIKTKREDKIPFEIHKKYMDIHIDLIGNEYIAFADKKDLFLTESYKNETDYELYNADEKCALLMLKKNTVVIIDSQEAHKPGIMNKDKEVTKCVFKILVN